VQWRDEPDRALLRDQPLRLRVSARRSTLDALTIGTREGAARYWEFCLLHCKPPARRTAPNA